MWSFKENKCVTNGLCLRLYSNGVTLLHCADVPRCLTDIRGQRVSRLRRFLVCPHDVLVVPRKPPPRVLRYIVMLHVRLWDRVKSCLISRFIHIHSLQLLLLLFKRARVREAKWRKQQRLISSPGVINQRSGRTWHPATRELKVSLNILCSTAFFYWPFPHFVSMEYERYLNETSAFILLRF